MKRTLAYLLYLIAICGFKSIKCDVEIDLINSFLKKENTASLVAVYTCWTTERKLNLMQMLQSNNHFVSINNINNKILENYGRNYKHFYVIDIDCKNSVSILKQANHKNLFSSMYTWILLSNNSNILKDIQENFVMFDIYQNSNVILAQKYENDTYLIQDMFKLTEYKKEFIINTINVWNKKDKFSNVNPRIIANERQNIKRTSFGTSIVVLENDTLNHLDDYRFKHVDSIAKVNYVLVKHLSEYLNATLKVTPVNSWGYLNPGTKYFTGMIGSIQKNESEIGGTALFMTKERLPVIDYLAMTTPTKVRFVFRQPPLSYQQNIFTLPFTRALWISSFCLVMLAILLLYLTVSWECKELNSVPSPDALKNSFLDCVMLTFAAVAQQGSTTEPRSGAGKIIMILTFIALMFLYVSYSANIVALLQSSATNIKSLEDLLESGLKLAADDIVYNRYYFSTATEPVHKAIYEKKIAPPGQQPKFIPLDEGVRMVRQGFFAFHMELGRGYKIVADTFYESEKCGIQEINYLNVVDAYLAVRKKSVYKEIFTLGLRKLRESGIQNRELSRIYTAKPECLLAGGSFVSVGLIDSYSAFLFLGAGILISLIFFCLEIFLSKREKTYQFCHNINYN